MKKIVLFLLALSVIINLSFSQSSFGILEKISGQLIEDLSEKDEWKAVGKAIKTAGEMQYEIEKIKIRNKKEITIITNPDGNQRAYPVENYKWKNPDDSNDYSVEKITDVDKKIYYTTLEFVEKALDYLNNGDFDNAIKLSTESLNKHETYSGYLVRSLAYFEKNMYNESLKDAGNILNCATDNETFCIVYMLKSFICLLTYNYEEALNFSNIAFNLASNNECKATILIIKGLVKMANSKFDEAIKEIDKAIEFNTQTGDFYVLRGMVKYSSGDIYNMKEVLGDVNLGISFLLNKEEKNYGIKTQLANSYNFRATIKYNHGNYKEALQDANNALEWNPKIPDTYALRGKIKIKLGFQESGCSDFYKAKELGLFIDEIYEFINNCK